MAMSPGKECHKVEVPEPSELPPLSKSDTHALAAALDRLLHKTVSCLPLVGFVFMVYSAGNAIYETKGEAGTVFFVASSFSLLGLLHLCMREFEKTRDTSSKEKNKYAVISLSIACLYIALLLLLPHSVPTTSALLIFLCFVAVLTNYYMFLGKYFSAGSCSS